MAIARVFDGKGWTPQQYDRLIERMDLGGRSAPGDSVEPNAGEPSHIHTVEQLAGLRKPRDRPTPSRDRLCGLPR